MMPRFCFTARIPAGWNFRGRQADSGRKSGHGNIDANDPEPDISGGNKRGFVMRSATQLS
jgi:hypothetical protein